MANKAISLEEIAAVVDVLNSEYLTTGPTVETFERKVAKYCSVKHGIAVSNGTAALHVAAMSLGVGKNGPWHYISKHILGISQLYGLLQCDA